MRRIEWLFRVALVFCLFYGAVAFADHSDEVFPFFAWDLFSTVPSPQRSDYSALLFGVGGVGKATWFEEAKLQPPAQAVQGYVALQSLGQYLATGQTLQAAVVRKRFESTYLSSLPRVRYQIVRRTYDIRRRVECQDCFVSKAVIGSFTKS